MSVGADLDKAFVPPAFQVAKDKRMFYPEEKEVYGYYQKNITDSEYLKTSDYRLDSKNDSSNDELLSLVSSLVKTVAELTERVTKLESLLTSEQSYVVVNTLPQNVVIESTEPTTTELQTVVPCDPVVEPVPFKYLHNDDLVFKLMNELKEELPSLPHDEQLAAGKKLFAIETIRNEFGYGKMGFASKYDGIDKPSADDIDKVKRELDQHRIEYFEQLKSVDSRSFDFQMFSQACNNAIHNEFTTGERTSYSDAMQRMSQSTLPK